MAFTDEDYKYKIINASPSRLVIVTYEIIMDRINEAKTNLINGDVQELIFNINNARQFVTELICSLNMNMPVALNLSDLYFYVNKLLTTGLLKKDIQLLDKALHIIGSLKNEFSKEVDDGIFSNIRKAAVSDIYLKSS